MSNEQALQAFKEILPYLETLDARTEAIMQLLTKTPPLREIDIQEKLNEVKASKRTKWNALRQKLEHVLEDKADI